MTITSDLGPYGIVQRCVASKVGATAFLVYAVLTTYSDRAGQCFPCIKTVAKMVGKSESTVQRAIKELELAEVVSVFRRQRADGSYMANVYTIHVLKDGGDPSALAAREEAQGVGSPVEGVVAPVTPPGVMDDRITIPSNFLIGELEKNQDRPGTPVRETITLSSGQVVPRLNLARLNLSLCRDTCDSDEDVEAEEIDVIAESVETSSDRRELL